MFRLVRRKFGETFKHGGTTRRENSRADLEQTVSGVTNISEDQQCMCHDNKVLQ